MRKKIIAYTLATNIFAVCVGCSSMSQTETYSITEAYKYPMTQDSEEWKALETPEERKAVFAVPDEIIDQMSTEALMETVLTNPYFADIWAFDSIDIGIEVVSTYVDGLAELIEREDFAEAVNLLSENTSLSRMASGTDNEEAVLKKELMEDVCKAVESAEH